VLAERHLRDRTRQRRHRRLAAARRLAVELHARADQVGQHRDRSVQLIGREQAVRRDAHRLDQLVGAAAQRVGGDAAQLLAALDVDRLDVERVAVAERRHRAGHHHVDADLLADLGEALVLAGAVAQLAVLADRGLHGAPARQRRLGQPVELGAEQGLEARDQLGLDAERVESPHADLLRERLLGAAVVVALHGRIALGRVSLLGEHRSRRAPQPHEHGAQGRGRDPLHCGRILTPRASR
jgi:hypothetical protein